MIKIPFHRPNLPRNLNKFFPDSVVSGWLTTGEVVGKFEEGLSELLDSEYVVAVNSCTAALHLTLAAKGYGKTHKFIAPALTFASTVECGVYLGMQPLLVDCEKDGFLIDLNRVEEIIKKDSSVKVVIPVHFAGEAVSLDNLNDIADKYGVFILEDAAHALEAYSNGIKIGNTRDAAAFSFYANKNLTTGGEGGAVSTNDYSLARKIKKLSLHGITKDGWNRFKTNGKWEYDITNLGYKYNLTDFSASFGLWQLGEIKQWQLKRSDIFSKYTQGLRNIDGIELPKYDNEHSKHLFVIRLLLDKWKITRNCFIKELNKKGIGIAVHYKPIHHLSYYRDKYDFDYNDYPKANSLFNSVLSLPVYPELSIKDLDYIIQAICDISDIYLK